MKNKKIHEARFYGVSKTAIGQAFFVILSESAGGRVNLKKWKDRDDREKELAIKTALSILAEA